MFIKHETGGSKSRLDWVVMANQSILIIPDEVNRNFLFEKETFQTGKRRGDRG